MRRRTLLLAARAVLSGALSVFLLAAVWGTSSLSRLQIVEDFATVQLGLITAPGWVFGTLVLAPEVGSIRGRALRRGLLIGLSALTFLVAFQIMGAASDRRVSANIGFAVAGMCGALLLAAMVRLIGARRLRLWQWVAVAGFAATIHLAVFPLWGGATLGAAYPYTIGWQVGVALFLLAPVPVPRSGGSSPGDSSPGGSSRKGGSMEAETGSGP
jgi:hypothetical protein